MRKLFLALHLVATVPLCTTVVTSQAWGQTGDRALALDLFEQGRALLKSGDVAGALPKFEAAAKQMHTFGILLNVAECQEKLGRTASAWATWRDARAVAAAAKNAEDEAEAAQRQAALEQKLSRLTTVVSPTADLPMLEVLRDGMSLPRAAWGSPTPVDPGKHVIEARAPGKVAFRVEIAVGGNGEAKSITITPLESEAAPVGPPPGQTMTSAPEAGAPADGKTRRLIGWSVAGAGAVILGVGIVEALAGHAKERDNSGDAHGDPQLLNELSEQYDAGKTQLTVGWVLTGIGGAAAITGAVIALTTPSASTRTGLAHVSPWAGASGAGLVWHGSW